MMHKSHGSFVQTTHIFLGSLSEAFFKFPKMSNWFKRLANSFIGTRQKRIVVWLLVLMAISRNAKTGRNILYGCAKQLFA